MIQLARSVGMEMRLVLLMRNEQVVQRKTVFFSLPEVKLNLYYTPKILNYFLSNIIWSIWTIQRKTPRITWYKYAFILRK
jgi:hypothetical protein